ncbi:MAG: hypothetical protein NC393_05515 [Clostridium sp.]|nr:hypothetical protein [Clostridium sp.]MCM1209468.1 hypothetical protein [Ruminococcus sp.]
MLLAVRGYEIYAQDEDSAFFYNFKNMNYGMEQYKVFMCRMGLWKSVCLILWNLICEGIRDYVWKL